MSRLPRPAPGLGDYLREQRRRVRQQGYASSFTRSGMNVTAEGEISSDDFDGDLDTEDPGTTGYAFNGQRAAFGDVLFRPGSIGNNSLASPVAPNIIYKSTSGFSVSKAGQTLITNNLVVPDGYTALIVTGAGKVHGFNDTANLDYLYSLFVIQGMSGGNIPEACSGNGGSITSITPLSVILTDLVAGDTVSINLSASTGFAGWATNSGNFAEMSAATMWFR